MHRLAAARYRYLMTIRKAGWLFLFSTLGVLVPASFFGTPERFAVGNLQLSGARLVSVSWLLQTLIIASACGAFGTLTRHGEGSAPADLLDTVPISSHARYWGDALGIFAATIAVHVSTLPMLAVIFAVSPFPLAVLGWLEVTCTVVFFLGSCAAAWMLRGENARWSRTRAARSAALFGILLLGILITTTRWEEFRDSLPQFLLDEPSPRTWRYVVGAFDLPLMSAMLMTLLYCGFVAFYYFHSVRTAEKA